MNKEKLATTVGALFAAVQASQVDWVKLANGDSNEISKIVSAVLIGVLGWSTNKK